MRTVNGCILLLAAISITFAAVSGAYHLDMQQLLALILRQENVPVQEQIVFWQIRVPRILAALFLGAALAGAGTTYQGMLRLSLIHISEPTRHLRISYSVFCVKRGGPLF
ncbi:iron chelate uptake ABC transporter family permease subunit, partial [Escherichia coli]